jgi:hypothetical protein
LEEQVRRQGKKGATHTDSRTPQTLTPRKREVIWTVTIESRKITTGDKEKITRRERKKKFLKKHVSLKKPLI